MDEKKKICGICRRFVTLEEGSPDVLPKGWTRTGIEDGVITSGKVEAEGIDPLKFGIQAKIKLERVMIGGDYSLKGYDICEECRGNLLRAVDTFLGNLLKVAATRRGRTWTREEKTCFLSGGL